MKSIKFLMATAMVIVFAFGASAQMIPKGGDKDQHGCIESAGYTFSVIKNNCVRLFDEKIQLQEIVSKKPYTSNAAVILSEDGKKAELFLPLSEKSIVLAKAASKNTVVYKKGKYSLTKTKDIYTLKKSNKIIFKS